MMRMVLRNICETHVIKKRTGKTEAGKQASRQISGWTTKDLSPKGAAAAAGTAGGSHSQRSLSTGYA